MIKRIESKIRLILISILEHLVQHILASILEPLVQHIITSRIRLWGDPQRLKIAPTAAMVNTLFNTSSGYIDVGNYTFTGHNVSIITGTHRYESFLSERMLDVPSSGRDILIGKGVWIGSNAIILGPCKIGDHAVIAAGSVVLAGTEIPPGTIVGGLPAKTIKTISIAQQLRVPD